MNLRRIVIAAAALAVIGSAGCKSGESGEVVEVKPKSEAEIQAQIDAVKNNPNIPEKQKGEIIGRMQAQRQMTESMQKTAPKK